MDQPKGHYCTDSMAVHTSLMLMPVYRQYSHEGAIFETIVME